MWVEAKPICKICRELLDEPILEHINKKHKEEFKVYPNPLADVVMREGEEVRG